MNPYLLYSLLKPLTRLGMAVCCLGLAWYIRSPFVASIRDILLYSVGGLTLFLITLDAPLAARRESRFGRLRTIVFVFALSALAILGMRQSVYLLQKQAVLEAPAGALRARGRFIISGYRHAPAMENLIRRGGVAGVYITARNVRGRTKRQTAERIARFQSLAAGAGLPPLLIAADQEGGVVNHLKAVLGTVPALASYMKKGEPVPEQTIRAHAERQARDLRGLGINVNFAPVVDLPQGEPIPGDRLTQIHARALGRDPVRVGRTALIYSRALRRRGIMPVLKHFPGLGRVSRDTHTRRVVELDTDLARLREHDWLPFRSVLGGTDAMMMLAHVRLTALDAKTPASYSPAVLGMLRRDWKHEGVLVTDDFSMAPVAHGPHGAGPAAVTALHAGMDLILIAYDVELYYPVMAGLLRDLKTRGPRSAAPRAAAARLEKLRESFKR